MSTLSDLIELLEEDLADSRDLVGDLLGPLPTQIKDDVAEKLEDAMDRCDQVLAQIGNAGTASSILPRTLPEIASLCVMLASAAKSLAGDPSTFSAEIGNMIKTIVHLIDDGSGYRDMAGITS